MFHFFNLDIKQFKMCHPFEVELWHTKDMNNTPIFFEMSRAEVSDKQVYYIVADDYDIL